MAEAQNWKPEVFVDGKWSQNGLVFATKDEAEKNARDLKRRWILVDDSRAVAVDAATNPVNYRWDETLGLIGVEAKAKSDG